jgi:hypothetical protein
MAASSTPIDEKSLVDIISILPRILPPIIEAAGKSPESGKSSFPGAPWNRLDKGPGDEQQKFLNVLVPVLTAVLPAVVEAVTKGWGASLGGGASTPFGNLSAGANVQFGKSTVLPADEQIWGDLIRIVLPPLIGAIGKSQSAPSGGSDPQKFLEILPIILPPLISALAR